MSLFWEGSAWEKEPGKSDHWGYDRDTRSFHRSEGVGIRKKFVSEEKGDIDIFGVTAGGEVVCVEVKTAGEREYAEKQREDAREQVERYCNYWESHGFDTTAAYIIEKGSNGSTFEILEP